MKQDKVFVARLTAHELLLRELIVRTFGRMDEPLESFDSFAGRLGRQLSAATAPRIVDDDPDLVTQELADATDALLSHIRGTLALTVGRAGTR